MPPPYSSLPRRLRPSSMDPSPSNPELTVRELAQHILTPNGRLEENKRRRMEDVVMAFNSMERWLSPELRELTRQCIFDADKWLKITPQRENPFFKALVGDEDCEFSLYYPYYLIVQAMWPKTRATDSLDDAMNIWWETCPTTSPCRPCHRTLQKEKFMGKADVSRVRYHLTEARKCADEKYLEPPEHDDDRCECCVTVSRAILTDKNWIKRIRDDIEEIKQELDEFRLLREDHIILERKYQQLFSLVGNMRDGMGVTPRGQFSSRDSDDGTVVVYGARPDFRNRRDDETARSDDDDAESQLSMGTLVGFADR